MSPKIVKPLAVLLLVFAFTSIAHAQIGSGPAPPPTAPTADKFANVSFVESVTCTTGNPCTHNIYRGLASSGPFGRINPAPFSGTTYRDAASSTPPPSFGVTNFYVVTAIQTSSGTESPQSAPSGGAAAVQGNSSVQPPTGLNVVLAILLDIVKGIEYAGKFVLHFLA